MGKMKSNTIKIRRGLDIAVKGIARRETSSMFDERMYAVKPTDYVGVVPRLLVAEGDSVLAGTPLMEDKNNPLAKFVSPVSGTVKAVVRGERRAIQAVVVESDGEMRSVACTQLDLSNCTADELKSRMVETGLWTLLLQRPYGIVPREGSAPKAVFVSGFDSSPLPIDMDYILEKSIADFQTGVDVLQRLAGMVYLSLHSSQKGGLLDAVRNAQIHYFEGPHPAGLTGTHIAYIDPINKGETVWTVNAQDVAVIGRYFRTGKYCPERVVALCGPEVANPRYYRMFAGASIAQLAAMVGDKNVRFVCGDILSGTSIAPDGFLSCRANKVCVLPEGDYYDFMGWLRPNFKKLSFSRTFISGLFGNKGNVFYTIDTGMHGSRRPLFVTGEFEKLVPLDIYPLQLIKACVVGDVERMEELGIYEVEPEDLALCEFADTSKTEIQAAIRAGLEKVRMENC